MALLNAGLIQRVDLAVLQAAERVDNLAWALDEMADSLLRRFVLRWHTAIGILFPVCVLLLGLMVACVVVGTFWPLALLIQANT